MQKTKKLLWLILLLSSFSAEAVSIIKSIRYEGNAVTQASVLNREIYINPGDILNEKLIEKSRQAIMDLGLFKSVHFYLEENYDVYEKDENISEIEVVFIVEEKYFILVIPKLKIENGDYNLGIQFQWDNVLGLNHKTRLLAEDRGNNNGIKQRRNSFRYYYPNINNSSYGLDVSLQKDNDVNGDINQQNDSYRVGVLRWMNERGRNRGWFAGGSLLYQQRFNEALTNNTVSENIEGVVLGIDVGYIDYNEYEFNRGGRAFGYKLDWSDENIGSKDEYTKYQLYYRSYYRFEKYPISNLNVQTLFGHSNNKILGDYAFSLGSSDDLRGYENGRFQGNTLFLTNIEYMFPREGRPAIRYVYFIDVGNTYKEVRDVFHKPLNVGAGLGLRWKIRSFVKTDLRIDVGYGFTDKNYKFSFGTRHIF